jgi:hypothetical protein
VTTFSLALVARWPDPQAECVVVEADPAGSDVAVRFDLPATPGLVSLAAACRRDRDPQLLWRHAQPLPGGLPVAVAPVGVEQTRAALAAIGDDAGVVRRAGDRDHAVVVADCGRLDPGSAAMPILRAADHVLLMVRADTAELAHVATRLAAISRAARRATRGAGWLGAFGGGGHPRVGRTGAGHCPGRSPRRCGAVRSSGPAATETVTLSVGSCGDPGRWQADHGRSADTGRGRCGGRCRTSRCGGQERSG